MTSLMRRPGSKPQRCFACEYVEPFDAEFLGYCEIMIPRNDVVGCLTDAVQAGGRFRAIADEMADRLPNARVAVIESAGHAAHVEAPDAVASVLDDFMLEQGQR